MKSINYLILDSVNIDFQRLDSKSKPAYYENTNAVNMQHYFYKDTTMKITKYIKQPKKIGNGETGLYIINLDGKGNNLSIYANNLNIDAQNNAIKLFESLDLLKK